jgi:exo-1,4-beta-D-glucosaminidase
VSSGAILRRLAALLLTVAAAAAAPCAASARTVTVGRHGWQVMSTAGVRVADAKVSSPRLNTASWLQVRPDAAGAVGTEVNALVQTGHCPNVFFSTNMRRCFGYMAHIGKDTIKQFAVPWWFRTTFVAPRQRGQRVQLIVNGVVGEADVWVNGHRIAGHSTVQGAYTRFAFDVTRLARRGVNGLALKVYPNDPSKMFTLDNVDWTQIPPDNNTGIQFPIQLHTAGPLAISNAHVVERNAADFSTSRLTLKATIRNVAAAPRRGVVTARVRSPHGRTYTVRTRVTVSPHAVRKVALGLTIRHPQMWWPYQMGAQPLYGLVMRVRSAAGHADSQSETFGIRTVGTRLIGAAPIAPQGSRQFLINGRPFMFRGGGWSENLFLHYSPADTARQIALIKNLGLNGIRTEGKQMPADFYEQMDRAGILIDAGYQCCDAWQLQDSKLTSPHDFHIQSLSALTIGENLRNHPSILNFSWSDNNPTPKQEAVALRGFHQADFREPVIASAEYKRGQNLGPSGEKEGPYDWVPPSYWYDTTHFDPGDPTRTNVGGAWAFNSEAGAGHTVPTLDSIQRFMSPFEQTQLWTNPDYNQYHANYEPDLPNPDTNGGYSFGTLHDLDAAITNRYGPWSSLATYVQEAQVQNYETQRAQFEAYIANSTRAHAPSTGLVYWQLNKGWPTLLWDLYNYDYDQAGSYFGAQKANEALHALYAYDSGTVAVDNLGPVGHSDLSVQAKAYDSAGNVVSDKTASGIAVSSQGVASDVLHPSVPPATTPPTPARTYFVELLLREHGQLVDRNVYWLSTQSDVIDWKKTMGQPQATMSQYASLRQLQGLAPAKVTVSAHTHAAPGPNGADTATDVSITNTSTTKAVSFFLRADVRRGSVSGTPVAGDNQVLPVFWNDNDITLWPGESETLHAAFRRGDLRGAAPVVSVSGWNVGPVLVPAS